MSRETCQASRYYYRLRVQLILRRAYLRVYFDTTKDRRFFFFFFLIAIRESKS